MASGFSKRFGERPWPGIPWIWFAASAVFIGPFWLPPTMRSVILPEGYPSRSSGTNTPNGDRVIPVEISALWFLEYSPFDDMDDPETLASYNRTLNTYGFLKESVFSYSIIINRAGTYFPLG
jgi:hypothetical protein